VYFQLIGQGIKKRLNKQIDPTRWSGQTTNFAQPLSKLADKIASN
jgi:hypothetical protein